MAASGSDGGGGLLEEAARLAEKARELHGSVKALISATWTEEQALRQRALALDFDLRHIHSRLHSAADPVIADKLDKELCKVRCLLNDSDIASLLPSSKSYGKFLGMFLGPVNVWVARKEVQLKVKEEYNHYRDRAAFLFLLFPSVLLFLRSYIWDECLPALPVQLYQAWLLFLYTSLAMRENILRINGSDIRPWIPKKFSDFFRKQMIICFSRSVKLGHLGRSKRWIYHHYCAMLMALVSLTWEIKGQPNCAQKQKGVQLFLRWAVMQGVAMLLQNRYQRQRLYTRIALGKAKRMDVVCGETAGVEGQLWLLCPILFILQGFEAYVGMLLLRTALTAVVSEWQVIACGILLVVMAIGNFSNTVQTLMAKSRFKAKMKRTKSKPNLDQCMSPNS